MTMGFPWTALMLPGVLDNMLKTWTPTSWHPKKAEESNELSTAHSSDEDQTQAVGRRRKI